MSGTSSDGTKKSMEEPIDDLSTAMETLSVTTDDSDETSKPPKNLSDMPFNVVGLVIERSGYKQQLILRKTSKTLRELVDKEKPALKDLRIDCYEDYIECSYDDQKNFYTSSIEREFGWKGRNDRVIVTDDYEKIAFDDVAFALKNPKLHLETFSFDSFYHDYFEGVESFDIEDGRNWESGNRFRKMQNILKSINHQLSVKACEIDVSCLFTAMSILPFLKPGALEKITIFELNCWFMDAETMKQVACLDQWKQAKELEIRCNYDEDFPKEHTTHFKRFYIEHWYIEDEVRDFIRDFVLDHESIEFCSIARIPENALHETYFDSIGLTPVHPMMYHYTIPESDNYFEITIEEYKIIIEKKKKQ